MRSLITPVQIFWCTKDKRDHKWFRRRPYRVECTGSLLTSEVKRRRARLVLGWGTAREEHIQHDAHEHTQIHPETQKWTQTIKQEYTHKYTRIPTNTFIHENIHDYTQICTNIHKNTRTQTNTHEHTRIHEYANKHGYTRIQTNTHECTQTKENTR